MMYLYISNNDHSNTVPCDEFVSFDWQNRGKLSDACNGKGRGTYLSFKNKEKQIRCGQYINTIESFQFTCCRRGAKESNE